MSTSERVDRVGLIARNEAVWDALASAFAGSGAAAAARTVDGEWSAKDHLTHVVAWEHHRLAVLRDEEITVSMEFTAAEWAAGEDAQNALIAERTRARPLAALVADLDAMRGSFGDALRATPDDRLATTYRTMHPEDGERGDGPLGEWAVGIAEAHIGAHLGPIRARLAEARGESPPTVAETLFRIDAATAEFMAAVREVADLAAVDATGWRAADHAFHVAAWDLGCAALLAESARWEAVGVTAEAWQAGDTDQINATIFAANQERPVAEALPAVETSRVALRHAVAELDDDDLLAAYGAFQPNDRPLSFSPVFDWVAENGWVHPTEHAAAIRRIGGMAD